MKRFYLEYAQYRNGEFSAWIVGGEFDTREEAAKCAHAHGLEGDDYMITDTWQNDNVQRA